MAGRKGRSGPPGNLNNARSIVPALARLRRGKPLPAPLQRVTVIADKEAEKIVSDKGGKGNLTGGEELMLNVWRTARQATLLILYEMAHRGVIVQRDGEWDLQPGAQRLSKFLQEERQALLALGLQRRPKDVGQDLTALLAEAVRDE
jgi:hypothetical protein